LQVGDLGGPILIGVIVLFTSILLADVASTSRELKLSRCERRILVTVVTAALAYGALRLDASYDDGPRATVGIVQGNVSPAAKQRDPLATLRRMVLLTQRLIAQRPVDIAVWSETSTGYSVDERLLEEWLRRTITSHVKTPLALGTGVISGPEQRVYNAAVSVLADGKVISRYDKQRLFPVGEYTPLPELVGRFLSPSHVFAEGDGRPAFHILDRPVGVTICYEALWPGAIRDAVRREGAELLLNLTNDIRFGNTVEPWAHFALTKLRAIEQRRYLLRAANSGVSAVVDPAGRVIATAPLFQEAEFDAQVVFRSSRTVYSYLGDAPWYVLSGACLLVVVFRRRRSWRWSRDAPRTSAAS
jgi:apolipoprotein N-acyltransferase